MRNMHHQGKQYAAISVKKNKVLDDIREEKVLQP